ncbi:MAG: hypothetical protein WKF34_10900 [Pyrinomonadaceae bacterium]
MSFRFSSILTGVLTFGVFTIAASGQRPNVSPRPPAPPVPIPAATPATSTVKGAPKLETAEQIAESAIFFYGYPGYLTVPIGRDRLNQIRKTTLERGTTTIVSADGKREAANYQRFVIRAGSLDKERIRLDQEFPTAKYSLVFNDNKIYGVFNNTVFTPRDDAAKTFENQIIRGLEALLRYKENGSAVALAPREKLMGVDYFVLDVTDKQERKTRFYVSVKTFRVMMLTYEEAGVKYRRRYYDYNYAQGTLVPYRSVLWANDKIVEETDVGTITFGQRVDEGLFASS